MSDARTRLIVAALPDPGSELRLAVDEAAHLRARRAAVGDRVVLLDGSGRRALSELVEMSRTGAVLRVHEILPREAAPVPISLHLAGLRPERLAWAVEKATELGASRVEIVVTARTQAFRAAASLLPRLERVAREAAKQCGRADWPEVGGPVPLSTVLAREIPGHRLFVDFDADRFPGSLAASPAALVVGPEGGFTAGERESALKLGWRVVSLPAGILRAETAAVAALVLLGAALEGANPRT